VSNEDFYKEQGRILELYRKGKYPDALESAHQALERFPEMYARITYWIVCLYCLTGEYDSAIHLMREALSRNVWWSEERLLQDPDLRPLHEREEFKTILDQCKRFKAESQVSAKPSLTVLTPPSYSFQRQYPLLAVLGFNASDDSRSWKSALSSEILVSLLQSSQPYSSDMCGWNDIERSERDVTLALARAKDSYSLDGTRTILAGFSQGAALAIYIALKKTVPCRGFIGVAPSVTIAPSHAEEYASFIRQSNGRGLKGWLLSGEKDCFFPKVKPLHGRLVQGGLDCRLVVEPGLGHEFPPDFGTKLASAIRFVLS
jgi:predicted esterase